MEQAGNSKNHLFRGWLRLALVIGILFFVAGGLLGATTHFGRTDVSPSLGLKIDLNHPSLRYRLPGCSRSPLRCQIFTNFSKPSSSVDFSSGSFLTKELPKDWVACEEATILGQQIQWHQPASNGTIGRITSIRMPDRQDIQVTISVTAPDVAELKTVLNMVSSLSVDPTAEAYQPKARASVLLAKGDRAGELIELDKHLALHPNDWESLLRRAYALEAVKRYEDAESTYARLIALDGNNHEVWDGRAGLFLELGRFEESLADCEKSKQLNSTGNCVYEISSDANRGLGRYQQAIEDITKAYEYGQYDGYLVTRAKLYRQIGKYQLAINDCNRAPNEGPEFETLKERAVNYELLGKHELARKDREELAHLRKVFGTDPTSRPFRVEVSRRD